MGALYKNVCYPDPQQARLQACSTFGTSSFFGQDLVTADCTSTDYTAPTMTLCKRINGGSCTTVEQPWPITPECDFEGGISLSYDYFLAALFFLVTVWGGKKLLALFDHHHADS